jgi:hypothetical protein
MTLKEWIEKRKIRRELDNIRRIEIREVNSYMGYVYNPPRVTSKPKYRQRQTPENKEYLRNYIHKIYDPPIMAKHRKDHSLNEYMEKGET